MNKMKSAWSIFCWVIYGTVVFLLALVAFIFTSTYQSHHNRSSLVSTVTIITLTLLFATVLLLPVDIALISSTNSSKLGAKRGWATPEKVQEILYTLKITYFTFYFADAILCLLIIPFTYFFYEEYDEIEAEEGQQGIAQRISGALKYTSMFVIFILILFFTGSFIPFSKNQQDPSLNLDYFRRLFIDYHVERAMIFGLGTLIFVGTIFYIVFTAAGMAILPMCLIKPSTSIDASRISTNTADLNNNRERQNQLRHVRLSTDRAISIENQSELDRSLEEHTLVRSIRFSKEILRSTSATFLGLSYKHCVPINQFRLVWGVLLLTLSITIFTSILATEIYNVKKFFCKERCHNILNNMNVFQPADYIFVKASSVFPLDQIIMATLVLFLFSSSVVGLASIGIRFFWVKLFEIRKARTLPQAMLITTVILALNILALNYSITMKVAPRYAMFGTQTFCSNTAIPFIVQPDCFSNPELILPCSEMLPGHIYEKTCTPSVASSILRQIAINFPFFETIYFWAQLIFLAVFLLCFPIALFKNQTKSLQKLDELAEDEEEEFLLSNTET